MNKFRDIDEYHALFPDDIQKILEQLRQTIKQAAPQTIETISYGMPAFKQNKVLVYYAVHKEHIGFYPTPKPIVHFKRSHSVSAAVGSPKPTARRCSVFVCWVKQGRQSPTTSR